jgi:hypothetical protein
MKEGSSGGASLCQSFLQRDLSFHGGPGREPGGVPLPGLLREKYTRVPSLDPKAIKTSQGAIWNLGKRTGLS